MKDVYEEILAERIRMGKIAKEWASKGVNPKGPFPLGITPERYASCTDRVAVLFLEMQSLLALVAVPIAPEKHKTEMLKLLPLHSPARKRLEKRLKRPRVSRTPPRSAKEALK